MEALEVIVENGKEGKRNSSSKLAVVKPKSDEYDGAPNKDTAEKHGNYKNKSDRTLVINKFYVNEEIPPQGLYQEKVDYEELFAHMGKATERTSYKHVFFANEAKKETVEEHEGFVTHEEAESMVERIVRAKAFQQLVDMTEEEKEKFRYWRLFNKVWRRFYESLSPFRANKPYQQTMTPMQLV